MKTITFVNCHQIEKLNSHTIALNTKKPRNKHGFLKSSNVEEER